MIRAAFATLAVALVAALIAADGRASLHHPTDQRATISVDEEGKPEALPFDPQFKLRRVVIRNLGIREWKGPIPSERTELEARIKKAQAKPAASRTPEESVALAIDLLHFGQPDEAAGALRGQRRGFLPNITLAHIAATQGQWSQAYDYLDIANSERPPTKLPGMSPEKLAWQLKLNRGALKKFIKLRWDEEKGTKPPPEAELPDRIWDVNFVNDAGQYEPGKLAAAEQAKLPGGDFREAIATVQQLVLWFPYDVRLYWLLGELYAAKGDVKAALDIMNECVDSGRYSNRKVLMDHREEVRKAANATPPPEEQTPPPDPPVTFNMVWIYFGVVGAVALLALIRAILRRGKAV